MPHVRLHGGRHRHPVRSLSVPLVGPLGWPLPHFTSFDSHRCPHHLQRRLRWLTPPVALFARAAVWLREAIRKGPAILLFISAGSLLTSFTSHRWRSSGWYVDEPTIQDSGMRQQLPFIKKVPTAIRSGRCWRNWTGKKSLGSGEGGGQLAVCSLQFAAFAQRLFRWQSAALVQLLRSACFVGSLSSACVPSGGQLTAFEKLLFVGSLRSACFPSSRQSTAIEKPLFIGSLSSLCLSAV